MGRETRIIVFKERIYKIWKQFTTVWDAKECVYVLCSKNEYTKSESNSQQDTHQEPRHADCVQRTNIQNLKAIHNREVPRANAHRIVFKERIYKIWKQFTTLGSVSTLSSGLCSKNEYTKSESNSQRPPWGSWRPRNCVQRTNIQNLKAIHNSDIAGIPCQSIVFKERIYKIWKQFTTYLSYACIFDLLCSKNEYTKSESNSQQCRYLIQLLLYCVQRTNIQNLKAIHNLRIFFINFFWLCSKNEYTKSESNSQRL